MVGVLGGIWKCGMPPAGTLFRGAARKLLAVSRGWGRGHALSWHMFLPTPLLFLPTPLLLCVPMPHPSCAAFAPSPLLLCICAPLPTSPSPPRPAFLAPSCSAPAHLAFPPSPPPRLQEVLDEDRGTAQQIATTSYALREPLSTPSVWVEHAVRCYTHFAELISRADLPFSAVLQVREVGSKAGAAWVGRGEAAFLHARGRRRTWLEGTARVVSPKCFCCSPSGCPLLASPLHCTVNYANTDT